MTARAAPAQLDFFDPTLGSIPGHLELESQHEGPLPDDDVRDRIKGDLAASLFVEAAAGAGKTTALVSRIVSLVGAGKGQLENMVAVTFTHRAAGEMKLRLRRDIEEARTKATDPEVRRRFVDAVRQLEVARIGTIHSLCADLLRERPVEAGVDPLFRVLSDTDAARLMERAFDRWFQETLEDPPEGVRRVLSREPRRMPGANWSVRGPRQELRDAVRDLIEHRDFPAPWSGPEGFDHAKAMDEALDLLRELAAFATSTAHAYSWLARGFQKIGRFVEEADARERTEPRDHDALEAGVRELLGDRKCGWDYGGPRQEWWDRERTLRLDDVKARRDEIRPRLQAILEEAEADLAARLREELRPTVAAYEELKRREGALDFVDLLIRTRDLIRENEEVRRELQARFTHFFVDEFQDTDPLQAEILLLLAADDPEEVDYRNATPAPGKLFLVGDPKQSIYSFRRADVRIYEETKRRLTARGTDLLHLTTSFRSVPGIQEAVNAVFEDAIRAAEDGSQPAYVPLERFRGETAGQPAVVALPAPRIHSRYGNRAGYVISDSYADAAAAFVRWLVEESGWRVTEPGRPKEPVELRYRHVCILSRRLQSRYEEVMRPYVRALEAREVPHVLVGGKGFHEREEVLALRNALQAIEWPDDALSVYATLKGPFFALTDAQLLAFKHRHGSLHPLRPAPGPPNGPGAEAPAALTAEEREVAEALRILGSLHAGRNHRPIAHTISRFLDAVRAHAGLANWRAGEQVLANCLRIVDRARAFEADGASSFRAFVELLEDEAERGEGEDAPIVEEGTRGVRIMSVHRAKGLEFPVVILADPTCNATLENPSRHVDPGTGLWAEPLCGAVPQDVLDHREEEAAHDHAEAVRLAYVAATRARDLLVLPAVGEGEELTGWAEFLNPAVYPEPGARRSPGPPAADGAAAPGCPPFVGEETVLGRPERADPPPTAPAEAPVVPGLHTSRAGTPVVWWDPASLELDVEEAVGLRQQEILAADEAEEVSTAGTRDHEAWREQREATTRAGRQPEARVVTARAVAARRAAALEAGVAGQEPVPEGQASGEPPAEPAVEVVRLPRTDAERPGGARFGELVHRALAVVDLEATAAGIEATVEAQARILGASPEERQAAVVAVTDVLRHPLLRRAAEAGRRAADAGRGTERGRAGAPDGPGTPGGGALRREAPVFLETEGGELVEGVVDLVFRLGGSADQEAGSPDRSAGSPDRSAAAPDPTAAAPGPPWTVVDFKTDREVEGALASYREQVAIYALAIERATREEARGILLIV